MHNCPNASEREWSIIRLCSLFIYSQSCPQNFVEMPNRQNVSETQLIIIRFPTLLVYSQFCLQILDQSKNASHRDVSKTGTRFFTRLMYYLYCLQILDQWGNTKLPKCAKDKVVHNKVMYSIYILSVLQQILDKVEMCEIQNGA